MTQRVQQWVFTDQYELIGLYGTSSDRGISNLGIIVFKANECTIYFGDVAVADELPEEVPQSNEDDNQNTEELIEEEIQILNDISEANI